MGDLKPDASQIEEFLKDLATEDWVRRTERNWWPQFVFHYTDIRNAVNILRSGYLYSRYHSEKTKQLVVSSGSPAVLAGTDAEFKDCVRLYFRPKTPTQFYAEGIQSQITLSKSKFPDAHCPVPVFLLFSASAILARSDCRFSDGCLGTRTRKALLSTADELKNLPWQQIYHTGWTYSRDIIFHRQAEITIPRELDLDALCFIYCRSEAERETLFHLLTPDLLTQYHSKIIATTRYIPFYRQHTFVERARLFSNGADFHFSPETQSPGPFSLQVDFNVGGQQFSHTADHFLLEGQYVYRVTLPISVSTYTVRLLLDAHPAYANTYQQEDDIPF